VRVLRLSVKVTSIVGLLLFTPCAPEAEVSPGAAPKAAPPVAPRVAKIGFLFIGSPGATATAWLEALRGGLAALGYVVLKPRSGEDSVERLDAAAAELTSLARPGGNVTRLVDISPELSAKRLQLWRETVPESSGVPVLWNSANAVTMLDYKMTRTAAQTGPRACGCSRSSAARRRPRAPGRWLECSASRSHPPSSGGRTRPSSEPVRRVDRPVDHFAENEGP